MIHTESIIIDKTSKEVFEYLKIEENHPNWGVNFLKNYEFKDNQHYVTTPMGRVTLKIDSDEPTGVIDIMLDGKPTPTRIISLPENTSLYLFTLILPELMPKQAVQEGIKGLKEELLLLKQILEN